MYLERRHWDIDLLEHLDADIDKREEELRECDQQQPGIVVHKPVKMLQSSMYSISDSDRGNEV